MTLSWNSYANYFILGKSTSIIFFLYVIYFFIPLGLCLFRIEPVNQTVFPSFN